MKLTHFSLFVLSQKFDASSISMYPKYLESILDTTQVGKIEEFKKIFDNK